jgi:uncharacterized protein
MAAKWSSRALSIRIRRSRRDGCAPRIASSIPAKSLPYRPYHTHDDKQPLTPGQVYELDVEVWPMSIILPAGFHLALDIRGRDFERPGTDANPAFRSRGSGPWIHDDPSDRPASIFGGKTTLLTGPGREAFLLLPVIRAGAAT